MGHLILLVSPLKRARIMAVMAERQQWKGTRAGVRMSFRYDPQPDLEGRRVVWSARANGIVRRGRAATVYDAIQEIEAR
jgi:hypothetical protein